MPSAWPRGVHEPATRVARDARGDACRRCTPTVAVDATTVPCLGPEPSRRRAARSCRSCRRRHGRGGTQPVGRAARLAGLGMADAEPPQAGGRAWPNATLFGPAVPRHRAAGAPARGEGRRRRARPRPEPALVDRARRAPASSRAARAITSATRGSSAAERLLAGSPPPVVPQHGRAHRAVGSAKPSSGRRRGTTVVVLAREGAGRRTDRGGAGRRAPPAETGRARPHALAQQAVDHDVEGGRPRQTMRRTRAGRSASTGRGSSQQRTSREARALEPPASPRRPRSSTGPPQSARSSAKGASATTRGRPWKRSSCPRRRTAPPAGRPARAPRQPREQGVVVGDPVEHGAREDRVDRLVQLELRAGRPANTVGALGPSAARACSTIEGAASTAITCPRGSALEQQRVTRPVPQPGVEHALVAAQLQPLEHRLPTRHAASTRGGRWRASQSRGHSAVVTGPLRSRSRS